MKPGFGPIDRRTLLIGGGVGIGLVVAFAAWPRGLDSALGPREGEHLFGHFIRIGSDGRVTVAVPQVETGQGIWTALPQLVADELGAAWESVGVEPAPFAPAYANALADEEGWLDGLGTLRRFRLDDAAMRITAGSTSVRAFEQPMRAAGATARAMLIAAAADRWGVPAEECDTADSMVLHGGKTLPFAQVAEEAARQSPPSQPTLRTGATNRLAGKPLPRLDLPAKSDGSFRFAADVRLPEMLYASARLAPPNGRVLGFDRTAARRMSGVREIIDTGDWIAIVAETSWAAQQAIRAANPRFSGPKLEGDARQRFEAAFSEGDFETLSSRGNYDDAVEGSRPLEATYWVAPAEHAALEPITATARPSGGGFEVWAPSQAPELARSGAARTGDLSTSDVTLYPMPVGEPGGRSLEADALPIAVRLSRRLNRPVQVSLSPGASSNHAPVAPGALARLTALPAAGALSAWKMQLATANGLGASIARLTNSSQPDGVGSLDGLPPYSIPNVLIEAAVVRSPYRTGYMRAGPHRALTFFTESFIDELARLSGVDPLVFRIGQLGGNPRLARCLQTAAAAGGWDGGRSGSTLGLAACSAFGSHIALLANATIGADQGIEVHRLTAAVDCGRIVNPQLVRQQIEGGLLWALDLATAPAPDWIAGMPRARTMHRLRRIPELRVDLVNSNADPGGVSSLAAPVLAPAIANAIHAGSGRRLRSLPFDTMSVA